MNQVLFKVLWSLAGCTKRTNLLKKSGVKIGTNCEIYRDVNFGSEPYLIIIGDHVRITNGVKFCTHDGGMLVLRRCKDDMKNADKFGAIHVGNNVHIGWNTIVMPGVTIGNNCIIGCGSVVTKNIPDNTVACGVPARPVKTIEEYYQGNFPFVLHTAGMRQDAKKKVLLKNIWR